MRKSIARLHRFAVPRAYRESAFTLKGKEYILYFVWLYKHKKIPSIFLREYGLSVNSFCFSEAFDWVGEGRILKSKCTRVACIFNL